MFLDLPGQSLTVHARDEGPPGAPVVLMLHSIGTDLRVWDEQAVALSRTHRVLRPDLRGHGLSGGAEGEATMAMLARDALALLDARGVARAHLVGLSVGGRVAMEVAASAPDRVLSLVACDTALEFPPPEAWQSRMDAVRAGGMAAIADAVMARWVVDASLPSSRALRRVLLGNDPAGYACVAAALRDARAAPLIGRIACPTTVVVGEADPATPVASAEAIRGAVPGARLVVVPRASHIPTFEAAGAVTAAIRDHLAAQEPDEGLAVRRAVLGEAHVARASAAATPLDAPFQDWITRNVWGGVWTRPGLPRHTRSLLTLAVTAALGRSEEFALHVRATANTGVTPEELSEALLQVGVYAGVPAANHALKLAKETLAAEGRAP